MFDLDENKYIFGALKIKDKFFAYALKKELNLKIPKKYIKSIYLAQSELYEYDCIDTGEHSIKKVEDILFCFPKDEECQKIDVSKIKLSKNSIVLDTVNIDTATMALIASVFIIFNLIFLTEGILYKKEINKLESKKTEMAKKYNLPTTSFQLNSIYDRLQQRYDKIKTIKSDLEFFTKTPLSKNDKYLKLSYDSVYYNIEIRTDKNYDYYFKKRFNVSSKSDNTTYKAKLSHE